MNCWWRARLKDFSVQAVSKRNRFVTFQRRKRGQVGKQQEKSRQKNVGRKIFNAEGQRGKKTLDRKIRDRKMGEMSKNPFFCL